jgi:hypothetical protein
MLMIAMIYHHVTVNCSLDIRHCRRGMLVLPQNLVSVCRRIPAWAPEKNPSSGFLRRRTAKQDAQRSTVVASI